MSRVGFLGLGTMGSRMAARLLDAGHDLVVWNRTPAKAAQLVAAGAQQAETPAAAVRGADVVMSMLADPAALRAVIDGPDGVAHALPDTATLIDMSTIGPGGVAWLAEALPAAAGLLDAPVLGSIGEAEAGSLRIFVGGPAVLVDRWTPLLSALGAPVHVGPLGSGAAAKLVANSTLLGVLAVLGEALALGERLGLSAEAAWAVLAATPLAAQAERRRSSVDSGEYPPRFRLSLARKDADLVVEAAVAAGLEPRLAGAVRRLFADAEAAGLGEADYAAVLGHILGR